MQEDITKAALKLLWPTSLTLISKEHCLTACYTLFKQCLTKNIPEIGYI
jgi:hypothetical protein